MAALLGVPVADNNKKLSLDELAQDYGFAAAFFDSDPELKNLINQAVANQWSVARFQAAFMATNWYRSRSDTIRQFQELETRDPATASLRIDNQQIKLSMMASQAGISIDPGTMRTLARNSLMYGWSDQLVQATLANYYTYSQGSSTGSAGTDESQIRQAINDYGLTVSDDTVGNWVKAMLSGSYTMDNVTGLLKNMAMSKYPGLNQYLSQGLTVRDVADPYIQSYSQILEQAPNSVQLSDPLIQKALQGISQPPGGSNSGQGSTGTPIQPQSLYDFERTLRQDPRWLSTKNAHDSLQQTGMGILRSWGLYS